MKGQNVSKDMISRILKDELSLKAVKTIRGQKLNEKKEAKRLSACNKWLSEMKEGTLDPLKIVYSDEKLFRCGKESSGSGQNNRIWVDGSMKKSDIDDPRLYRASETWGKSVMVAMCVSVKGIIGPIFVRKGVKIDGQYYQDSLLTQYLPKMRAMHPDGFVFQEDGAPAHRKKAVRTYLSDQKVKCLEPWPPTSPDLNVLDYYAWSVMQRAVDRENPSTVNELEVAILNAANNLPLEHIIKAVKEFPRRLQLCVDAKGGRFERKKKRC